MKRWPEVNCAKLPGKTHCSTRLFSDLLGEAFRTQLRSERYLVLYIHLDKY